MAAAKARTRLMVRSFKQRRLDIEHRQMAFTNTQFARSRELALTLAGIELFERHREVLTRRAYRRGIQSVEVDQLLQNVEVGEPEATRKFLGLVTTKFTEFFRHPTQFEICAEHALNEVRQRGRARVWSAAASTGQEPYSLAMALIEKHQSCDLSVDILATDIDEEALASAQIGEYGNSVMLALNPERRRRFFVEVSPGRRWAVGEDLRQLLSWQILNLNGATWSINGLFDVILCRNILMYLEAQRRQAVLERICLHLRPGGLLAIDPAEHLGKAEHRFVVKSAGVYSYKECQCSREAASLEFLVTNYRAPFL